MFKFRSKVFTGTGTGIPVDLCWSIKAMIRNWVGYECRLSAKQLMMTCMLLLEVACRFPESRKKLTAW